MNRRKCVLILSIIAIGAGGCAPQQRQITCPTAQISCPCAELERAEPAEEVGELISSLRAITGERLQIPSRAAETLAARCRDDEGLFPPASERRDPEWQEQCEATEVAIPALLETLVTIETRREASDREQNSSEENSLASQTVSALGNILLGNPESACRQDVVRALTNVLTTDEPAQDMSVNLLALRMLGRIGDAEATAALVRAMFMGSQRRSLSLQDPAQIALMELRGHQAVAEALVRAGRMEDERLQQMQRDDPRLDVRLIKEQVAITLGLMSVSTPTVVSYLMDELNHTQVDDLDRSPPREGERLTPEQSAAWRRVAAARALGRMGHEPALDVIVGRLSLDTEAGRLVDPSVDILEVPGYLEAMGSFLMPPRTNSVLLDWAVYGLDINRDKAALWLSIQGSFSHAEQLAQVAAAMPACTTASGRCIRRNFDDRYVPVLRSAAGCSSFACWAGRLTSPEVTPDVRIRAAYQVAILARGSQAGTAQGRGALIDAITSGAEGELFQAYIFAIDRLSPNGCDHDELSRLEAFLDEQRGATSYSGNIRGIAGLVGRLRDRLARYRQSTLGA